jgi:hypothetical protein
MDFFAADKRMTPMNDSHKPYQEHSLAIAGVDLSGVQRASGQKFQDHIAGAGFVPVFWLQKTGAF